MTTPRYLLDTNICIYIRKHRPQQVLTHFQKIKPGDAVISVVTWGELLFGAEKSQNRSKVLDTLEEFTSIIPILPMSEKVGPVYGSIRATLEAHGRPIGNNDLWIAAHAKAEGLALVTNNEKEFKRVAGLRVLNWTI